MRTATSRYFDAASALPPNPAGLEAMQAAFEDGWADPARLTNESRRAAVLLNAARAAIAAELQVEPDEIAFTGSGPASLHLAVLGSLAGRERAGKRLVHSAVEHSAVLHAAEWHCDRGGTVEVVPVDATARVDADVFIAALQEPGVAAAVLQAANHEVGTRQPVREVSAAHARGGVPLVVDATHVLPYGNPDVEPGAAVVTGDARMWGGPSGVGVLVVPRGTRWRNPYPRDEAEFGRGAGPANIPAIVGAAAALRAVRAEADPAAVRLRMLTDRIRTQVPRLVDDTVVLGDPANRLPHIVTFSCLHVEGEALLTELARRGFAASSGSSCTSDTLTPSHVLAAMGALTSGNVRLSLHPEVSDDDVDEFLDTLPEVVRATRAHLPDSSPLPAAAADSATRVVDARGKRCPMPVLELSKAWPDVPVQGEVVVIADDPAAATDIAAWARMRGQQLVSSEPVDEAAVAYRLRRLS